MKTKTLYNRKKRVIVCLLSLALLTGVFVPPSFSNVYMIEADASPLVPIGEFLGKLGTNVTLAETIISSLLSAGAGVTNTSWLNQLNNAYGTAAYSIGEMYSQGLFEVVENASTGAYEIIDHGFINAVESVSAFHNLGIDEMFAVTAEDAEMFPGVAVATGGTTLLKTILGGVSLGTVGAAAGAVLGGVAVGVLAYKAYEHFSNWITKGAPIDIDATYIAKVPSGGRLAYYTNKYDNSRRLFYVPSNVGTVLVDTVNSGINRKAPGIFKTDSSNTSVNVNSEYVYSNGSTWNANTSISGGAGIQYQVELAENNWGDSSGWVYLRNKTDANSYMDDIRSGRQSLPSVVSPDIISTYGNAQGIDKFETPLENDEGLGFIPWSDYITDFVNPANTNTEDNLPDDNADVFRDFVNPYIETPEVTPVPNPNQPTNPEDVTNDPVTNPVPEQPDYTDKPDVTTSDTTTADDYTTPDLLDRFPFCIPKDIHDIFTLFGSSSRRAPHITFNYHSEFFNYDFNLDIDLAPFDDAAAIFRLLELILFIIGLAIATKHLIRW